MRVPLHLSLLIAIGLMVQASGPSAAWADASTDRLQAAAREILQNPYYKAPFPCSTFGASSNKDYYVIDVAPWAAASGVQRGDRVVAYGHTRLTGTMDTDREAWAKVPHGEYVDVTVERAGKEVPIRLPCRNDDENWRAGVALMQAIAEGRWQDCVDGVSRVVRVAGYASSSSLYVAIQCIVEKVKSETQRLPDEFWRRLHAWATKAIEESHYRPTGLAEVRGRLLEVTDALDKAGRHTLADDIKQQITTFTQAPPGTAPRESKTP